MRQSIHAFLIFDIDVAILGCLGREIIFFGEFVREIAELEAHIFLSVHGSVEVKILDINGH